MRILIAGCGYVGSALGARLSADGHHVFGLRRRAAELPPGVEPVSADLTDASALRALPPALDAVFYTAAADGRSEAAYRAAYVEGLARLLEALARTPPLARVFYTSSTSVHAQDDGSEVDETSATQPSEFSGRLVLEGEALLRASGAPGCTARLGGIYGPGRTRLLERVRAGARFAEGPPRWTNRIHRDDAAGALRHLLSLPETDPVYLVVDCEPSPEEAVLRWLAARLAAPEPKPEPDPTAVARRPGGKRCSNQRLLATGYRFQYPSFREGYAAMLGAPR